MLGGAAWRVGGAACDVAGTEDTEAAVGESAVTLGALGGTGGVGLALADGVGVGVGVGVEVEVDVEVGVARDAEAAGDREPRQIATSPTMHTPTRTPSTMGPRRGEGGATPGIAPLPPHSTDAPDVATGLWLDGGTERLEGLACFSTASPRAAFSRSAARPFIV